MKVDVYYEFGDSLSFMDSQKCHIVHDDRSSANYLVIFNGIDNSVMKVVNLDFDEVERIDIHA